MSKTPLEIRSLARKHTRKAVNCLAGIMNSSEAQDSARVAAANSLLDRGWGKPNLTLSGDPANPLTVIQRIERVIVKAGD